MPLPPEFKQAQKDLNRAFKKYVFPEHLKVKPLTLIAAPWVPPIGMELRRGKLRYSRAKHGQVTPTKTLYDMVLSIVNNLDQFCDSDDEISVAKIREHVKARLDSLLQLLPMDTTTVLSGGRITRLNANISWVIAQLKRDKKIRSTKRGFYGKV